MQEDKLQMFHNRLSRMYKHVSKLAKRQGVSCYRIYDHDIPEFPLCIEDYEGRICIAEYRRSHGMDEEAHENWLNNSLQMISEVLGVSREQFFLRQRQRKENRQGQYEKVDNQDSFFTVGENGLKFKVNLTDYLDTGLFLDHRITRKIVMDESENKKVLNLFCYTGSFSVYAAAGRAYSVDSVDLSKTYLSWAEDNLQLNGLMNNGRNKFIHADVKQFLQELPATYYDLVIMDPPTFSNSKRMVDFLDIQRDHSMLINQALDSMTKGGVLYFSNNYRKFELDQPSIRASSIKNITNATVPFDFQGKLARWCFRIIK